MKEVKTASDIFNEKFQLEKEVKCPTCGYEYTTPYEVELYCGNDDYETTKILTVGNDLELKLEKKKRKLSHRVRGLSFVVSFSCENGHDWKRIFAFHKGITYTQDFDVGEP